MSEPTTILPVDDLTVERSDDNPGPSSGEIVPGLMMTPALGDDDWVYRVALSEGQAVIGFWKFGGIGVGFWWEEDWNTNLPHYCTDTLVEHIGHNRGSDAITDEHIQRAVELIDQAVRDDGLCGYRACVGVRHG